VKQDVVRAGDAAARLVRPGRLDVLLGHAELFELSARLHLRLGQRPVVVDAEHIRLERPRVPDVAQPVAVADLADRVAIARRRTQDAADQQPAVVGHVIRRRVDAVEDAPLQLPDGVGAERQHADDHEVEEDAERPDVDVRPVIAVVAEQLRRRVRRRATERAERLPGDARRAEAEITQFDLLHAREVDVLGLQVPVHHMLLMLQPTSR